MKSDQREYIYSSCSPVFQAALDGLGAGAAFVVSEVGVVSDARVVSEAGVVSGARVVSEVAVVSNVRADTGLFTDRFRVIAGAEEIERAKVE